MITQDDIQKRFTYYVPNDEQIPRYKAIRRTALEFATLIFESTPSSREQSLAITALEEAVMWANAAIARNE